MRGVAALLASLSLYVSTRTTLGGLVISKEEDLPAVPPLNEKEQWARFIIHYTKWGTLSYHNASGHPLSRVCSFSDGLENNSTGIPYFYFSPYDPAFQTLVHADNRTSFTVSLAQTEYCRGNDYDPSDPRCAQVTLSGRLVLIDEMKNRMEYKWAKNVLFDRHPKMKDWPESHNWTVSKVRIENIVLMNDLGGMKRPDLQEYYKVRIISDNIF